MPPAIAYPPVPPPSWQRFEAPVSAMPAPSHRLRRLLLIFIGIGLFCGGLFFVGRQAALHVQARTEAGYGSLEQAAKSLAQDDYAGATEAFAAAQIDFASAKRTLGFFGGSALGITRFVPGLSKLSSGEHLISAGAHISEAGPSLVTVVKHLHGAKDAYSDGVTVSFLGILKDVEGPLQTAGTELRAADGELSRVNEDDLPLDKRPVFLSAKAHLAAGTGLLEGFQKNEVVLRELLGGNGPRKYLFLFQNNHELRPTGGFIGTYALLDMNDGVVRDFFVDGIFNPDGQLKENIVPPEPLQKISAGWSLHDSNWFPDFPTSAEKAIFFYEKTGGPTVDGVITVTPAVLGRLLAITGPIALPDYNMTVDQDNFIPAIQEQVEVKYDKTENKPKAVLGDLSEKLFEQVFATQDPKKLFTFGNALIASLNQKDILLYARNVDAQKLIADAGWSGKLASPPSDYLAVIHANINGYKTDGVIDEKIEHVSEIAPDGSVIDTVRVTRTHKGGNTPYEWWNKVNTDYMRVYVPEGAELLSASGMTWEFPKAPLDYDALGFRRDQEVEAIEGSERIDEATGTRIGTESGKTVFGNWVYVSPGESVTVEYRYRLPLTVRAGAEHQASFSVFYQKQPGTPGSELVSTIRYPASWESVWQTGGNLVPYDHILILEDALVTDKFSGLVWRLDH
ncbi:MAG: DUF4012 domain-containing protein, partial [Candidatus Moraniibacteriota bacterium]